MDIKLCIVGFGNASQAFCKLLLEKELSILKKMDVKVQVNAIAGRSKGSLLDLKGIDIESALTQCQNNGAFDEDNVARTSMNTIDLIMASNADVLVELSSLSIHDGQPAISHIETAFENGMHVITANKGPIAWQYKRLNQLAESVNRQFLFETTVMDGTPIFNLVKYTLPECDVKSFRGILNSTTNFVIEEMEKGNSYDGAILEAQRRGFAEADPSMDIDGWDAAAKTTAIINVLMDGNLTPLEIDRQGIGALTTEEILDARKKGKKIKLLCQGYIENGMARGSVKPIQVEESDVFATIDATSSILGITTDLMGEILIIEKNPEIEQTGYGIFSDLLTLLNHR